MYCVNLVHGQIDILDSFPWSEKERRDHHGCVAQRIRSRLNDLFQRFTKGKFPDFSEWGMPFVPMPKQERYSNDCGFFAMMFMEHYDGENRALAIDIDPVSIQPFFSYSMLTNSVIQ